MWLLLHLFYTWKTQRTVNEWSQSQLNKRNDCYLGSIFNLSMQWKNLWPNDKMAVLSFMGSKKHAQSKTFYQPNMCVASWCVILMYLMVICEIVYLCVIQESDSSVTWPERNISQPACAIIAPLSIQNLKARYHIKRLPTTTLNVMRTFSSDVRKEGDLSHLSSVAKIRAPLSLHMTAIISCRRRLPTKQHTDKTAIQRPSPCNETKHIYFKCSSYSRLHRRS